MLSVDKLEKVWMTNENPLSASQYKSYIVKRCSWDTPPHPIFVSVLYISFLFFFFFAIASNIYATDSFYLCTLVGNCKSSLR